MRKKKIVIVGGGITGLSAAYYLRKKINAEQLPYEVKLLEASDRLGGKIHTVRDGGFTIEKGADSFLARKEPGIKLVKSLGLQDQVIRNRTGQAYILLENKLHPIPAGSYMGIPVREEPFLKSNLVSDVGKSRAIKEVDLPKSDNVTDQTLGGFFRQRFGDELVENILEPLLSGIYSGDVDQMSLMATFPNFYQLEQTYGSLLRGLRETLPSGQASTGSKHGQFISFKNGLITMVEALEKELGKDTYKLQANLEGIERTGEGYLLQLENGEQYEADAVIMTLPHKKLAALFPGSILSQTLDEIPVTSVANVVLGFDEECLQTDLQGTGFLVSRNSAFRMTACTWTHKKWPETTPDGKVLLRSYVGKPTEQAIVDLSDREIVDIVLQELNQIMGLRGKPEFSMVTRWKKAMPQYTVGHKERLNSIRKETTENFPGLFLAGSSYGGVGIPDCIGQGENAVEAVVKYLK